MLSKQNLFQDDSLNGLEQPKNQMNSSFPELVQDLPEKATITIIQRANIKMINNWMAIAAEIWPDYSLLDIRSYFEKKRCNLFWTSGD
jgi:hypothetical protein